jgi:hypothetical protein
MRKSLTIAALTLVTALAACSKPATEAAPDASEAAATAAATAAAYVPTLRPGTYDVTGPDGKPVGTTTINADGTYADDDTKGTRTAGIVKIVDGKTCFDPSGKAEAECYSETAPGADGSFTATSADGVTVTVKPRA